MKHGDQRIDNANKWIQALQLLLLELHQTNLKIGCVVILLLTKTSTALLLWRIHQTSSSCLLTRSLLDPKSIYSRTQETELLTGTWMSSKSKLYRDERPAKATPEFSKKIKGRCCTPPSWAHEFSNAKKQSEQATGLRKPKHVNCH